MVRVNKKSGAAVSSGMATKKGESHSTCAAAGAAEEKGRALMDPELYLKKHHLMAYIEDVVSFLLERKDEDPKTRPIEVLAEYFKSIKNGTHILFREYSFISSTPHNRASFIKLFWHSYTEVAVKGEMMQLAEFLSLLRLLCYNFPVEIVQKVGEVLFCHNAMENLVSFPDFLYTFQVIFYYEVFLSQCQSICSDLEKGQTPLSLLGSTVVVSIPSFADQTESVSRPTSRSGSLSENNPSSLGRPDAPITEEQHNKQVDPEMFTKAVFNLAYKLREREPWQRCPSPEVLTDVIGTMQQSCSYLDFVLALSRSDSANAEIGTLPAKDSLLDSDSSMQYSPAKIVHEASQL